MTVPRICKPFEAGACVSSGAGLALLMAASSCSRSSPGAASMLVLAWSGRRSRRRCARARGGGSRTCAVAGPWSTPFVAAAISSSASLALLSCCRRQVEEPSGCGAVCSPAAAAAVGSACRPASPGSCVRRRHCAAFAVAGGSAWLAEGPAGCSWSLAAARAELARSSRSYAGAALVGTSSTCRRRAVAVALGEPFECGVELLVDEPDELTVDGLRDELLDRLPARFDRAG